MEDTPLFGDIFTPIEVPQLSTDSIISKVSKLPVIPKIEDVTQDSSILNNIPTFDFPINSNSFNKSEQPKKRVKF